MRNDERSNVGLSGRRELATARAGSPWLPNTCLLAPSKTAGRDAYRRLTTEHVHERRDLARIRVDVDHLSEKVLERTFDDSLGHPSSVPRLSGTYDRTNGVG